MRAILAALAIAFSAQAHANPDPGRLDFQVLRNGEPFGAHIPIGKVRVEASSGFLR